MVTTPIKLNFVLLNANGTNIVDNLIKITLIEVEMLGQYKDSTQTFSKYDHYLVIYDIDKNIERQKNSFNFLFVKKL